MGNERWEPKPGEWIDYRTDTQDDTWATATFAHREPGALNDRWFFRVDGTDYNVFNYYDGIAPLGTHTGAKVTLGNVGSVMFGSVTFAATPGTPGKEATMHAYTWNIWELNEKGERGGLAESSTEPTQYKNAHNAELAAWASFLADGDATDPDNYEIDVIQVGK